MTSSTIIPSESDLERLRHQVKDAKRLAEYHALKRDLEAVTYKAARMPNEFEGAMQIPDTDRVLHSKGGLETIFEAFFGRLRGMCSIRPIIGHIIALGLAMLAVFYIFNEIDGKWFNTYASYFSTGIELAAALTILKSASRSILLPGLALLVGGLVSHTLSYHGALFHLDHTFYERLMIVGIIGLGISIISID